jgi:hypothetical protein
VPSSPFARPPRFLKRIIAKPISQLAAGLLFGFWVITGQIISELSRLPGLFVIARNSSFSYKGKTVTEQQVGRDLGVKYILEGSVQKTADRIRIGAELVDSSSGIEMWSQQYDRPIKDIFVLQDEIGQCPFYCWNWVAAT